MTGGFSNKRQTVNDTVPVNSSAHSVIPAVHTNVRSGFCEDRLRCSLTKVGSSMMDFQDLDTDLSCMRDLTGRKERTSAMSSEGRVTGDALGGRCKRDGGRRSMSPFSDRAR